MEAKSGHCCCSSPNEETNPPNARAKPLFHRELAVPRQDSRPIPSPAGHGGDIAPSHLFWRTAKKQHLQKKSGGLLSRRSDFPVSARLLEKFHRISQRLQHAKNERNADEAPCQQELERSGALLFCSRHVQSSFYARAPAAPRRSPSFLLVFMWKRASTALTRKLQMNPTTSNPAMMYIVVL
jgi:hypothetical protein